MIERLAAFRRDGMISRVGAVFAPGTIGASTLAALEVPAERLRAVADIVERLPGSEPQLRARAPDQPLVCSDGAERGTACAGARRHRDETQCRALLALRLVEEFRIDLGFDLRGDAAAVLAVPQPARTPHTLTARERRLLSALQDGLPLAPRPFAILGDAGGISEAETLEQIRQWTAAGVIRRLGVVVRHRELGYRANAMVVWNVPDALVRPLGINLAQQAGVTLCYRRTRAQPRWDYNLYCMIHGKSRAAVLRRLDDIEEHTGLSAFSRQVLFSLTRFKQTGARYVLAKELAYG